MKICRKTIKPLLELVNWKSHGDGIAEGLALGLVTGMMIGGLVGVLFAPDEGIKTRRRSKRKLLEAKDTVEGGFDYAVDNVMDNVERMEDNVEKTVGRAAHMKNKLHRAGKAAKKELKK